ncbi:MAG: hypothetical protein K9G46_03430 [Flavobacteriales bacterium]|nr:hypothetical protein [Flavobacteriales bacterium]
MKALILSLTLILFAPHEFHLSLTEINHNSEKKTMEIAIKLFTDDLVVGLNQPASLQAKIGTAAEPPQVNELIESYIRKHFVIKVNGKEAGYTYLGKENELDATWCYVEVKNIAKVQILEVQNTLLIEAFDDQTNMVNLNINRRKKSGLARKGNTSLKFEF